MGHSQAKLYHPKVPPPSMSSQSGRRSTEALQPGPEQTLLRPGHNAWRVARADRFALLIDAAEYYRRLRQSLLAARRDVFLLGWAFDTRIELVRGEDAQDGAPTRLGELLDHIVSRQPLRRSLGQFPPRVHVLAWDFSTFFALDSDPLLSLHLDLGLHRRVRYEFDAKHPFGASHHQKLVVIDDALAFVGGTDLTSERWDNTEHALEHPSRVGPGGEPYAPHHEVQAIVDGPAAAALGELARARWKRASRRRVRPPMPASKRKAVAVDLWPADLEPDLCGVRMGVARTRPSFGGEEAVHEIERLYLDGIARARESIYLESQYLTARSLTEALVARLREAQGPEVVLVIPKEPQNRIEQWTLGSKIRAAHAALKAADLHGRLRIVYPLASRSAELAIYVHAKLAIFDDRWLQVGSANLTQRSLGFDTECDVLVEVQDEADRERVLNLRARLVGHWVGATAEEVRAAEQELGSLVLAIDRLGGAERGLATPEIDEAHAGSEGLLNDLEEPMAPTRLIDSFLPQLVEGGTARGRGPEVVLVGAVLLVTILALALRFTPLSDVIPLETLDALQERLDGSPWGLLVVLAVYVFATLALVPVHPLILATVLVFGGPSGGAYALLGFLLGALAHFGLVRLAGRGFFLRLLGERFARLAARLPGTEPGAIVAIRLLPVAPFVLVNLACAVARVPLRNYLLGTLLGGLPGILGIALFGAQVRSVLRTHDGWGAVSLVLIAGGFTFLAWILQRFLRDHMLGSRGAAQ